MANICEKYHKEVVPKMKERFGLKNNLEVPRVVKVTVNVGVGKYLKDGNAISEINQSLTTITGQKAVLTKSKKSIAGFKIREGLEVGIKVTLRGQRMWDFIERLVNAALPRVRDFRGISNTSLDSRGNLNIGIREHLIFPEVTPEQVKNIFGFQINVVTNANNRERGLELFRLLGFPIEINQ